jgi:hypothetical protein
VASEEIDGAIFQCLEVLEIEETRNRLPSSLEVNVTWSQVLNLETFR